MTLDDLEWPKRTLAEKMRFTKPTRRLCMKIDPYYQRQKCRPITLVSAGLGMTVAATILIAVSTAEVIAAIRCCDDHHRRTSRGLGLQSSSPSRAKVIFQAILRAAASSQNEKNIYFLYLLNKNMVFIPSSMIKGKEDHTPTERWWGAHLPFYGREPVGG